MSSAAIEPTVPAFKRVQAYAVDRRGTGYVIMVKSRRMRRARNTLYIGETTNACNNKTVYYF